MYSTNQSDQTINEVYLQGISHQIISTNQTFNYYDSATDFGENENLSMNKCIKDGKRKSVSQTETEHSNSPKNRHKRSDCQLETESNEIHNNNRDQSEKRAEKEDNFVHIRAKRGQATNSHSLAERVRREKISERMRLLQELVPGCNKITGKAMMLDEIINYVQSLQCQVEFLSMKLSAICPQMNFDLEEILAKNMICQQNGNPLHFGSIPNLSNVNSNFYAVDPLEIYHGGNLFNIPNSNELQHGAIPHFATIPQVPGTWDEEFQNMFQAGFVPNAQQNAINNSDSMKEE
ncbi:hypothetical protein LUZ60_006050 [Juncus effusus]|nr:hypothetical protein LUZ60_006050 [Juncus effusus]